MRVACASIGGRSPVCTARARKCAYGAKLGYRQGDGWFSAGASPRATRQTRNDGGSAKACAWHALPSAVAPLSARHARHALPGLNADTGATAGCLRRRLAAGNAPTRNEGGPPRHARGMRFRRRTLPCLHGTRGMRLRGDGRFSENDNRPVRLSAGGADSCRSVAELFVDGLRGGLARAHGEDDRGRAGDGVAAGVGRFQGSSRRFHRR